MYLIKFNISNPVWIPAWVRRVVRQDDQCIDTRHALKATKNGPDGFAMAQIGRVREGRVDTGLTPGQRDMVAAGDFHQTMAKLGQNLVNIHSYVHHRPGKGKKFVLVFVYDDDEQEQCISLTQKQWENLRFFQDAVWKYCHLWVNPEEDNITVNFTSISEVQIAQLILGVDRGFIAFVPSETAVAVEAA